METAQRRGPQRLPSTQPQFIRTAKSLLLRRRTKEAINLLRRGLNLDPGCREAALLLAKSLIAIQQLKEAQVVLEKLLAGNENPEVYALLVRVLLAQGDGAGAGAVARQALAAHPGDTSLRRLLARLRWGGPGQTAPDTRDAPAAEGKTGEKPDDDLEDPEDKPKEREAAQDKKEDDRKPEAIDLEDRPTLEFGEHHQRTSSPVPVAPAPAVPPPDIETVTPSGAMTQRTVPGSRRGLMFQQVAPKTKPPAPRRHAAQPRRGTPTPLPSDDLEFDRRSAPDLVSAVRQLVEQEDCDDQEEPPTPRRPLFARLLEDGPPRTRRLDQGQGESPAPTPKRRLPGNPTLSLRGHRRPVQPPVKRFVDAKGQPHRIDESRVARPLPDPMPARISRARLVPPETTRAAAPTRRPRTRRLWGAALLLAVLAIAGGSTAGLMVRKQHRAAQNIQTARALAGQSEFGSLHLALERLRIAADLVGRRADILSLAAATHARLAVEFGFPNLQGAESLLDEATRLGGEAAQPSSEDLTVAGAYIRLAQLPLPDAVSYLYHGIERFPQSLRLRLMYGEALTLNGEHYLAERVLEGLTSSSGGVLRARARLRAAQGAWDGARALLRTAQMYELPRSEVDLHLVQLRVDEGTADGRSLGTLESIASAASTPPRQQALALLLAATVQQAQGRIDRARASLSRAITIRKIPDPELSYRAGLLFLKLHDLENARREATEGVRLSPRNPRLADLMARIDVALDRPADAVALLTRWGEPAGASARLTLAEAYLRLEQPTRAAAALAKVSEPSIRRRFLSARIQLALGKPYLALRELRDLGADQTAAEAQRIRGLAALSLGDAQQAVATFQAALALDPLDAEALVSLARIARDRGDAKESQAYLARAVRSSPHLRQARLELAQLLLRLGEFGAARTQLDETLALEGSNRAALLGRARVAVELDSKDADFFLRALQVQGHGEATALLSARRHMVRGEWQAAADRLTELTLGKRLARDPDTLLWLGMALQKIGDVETAALTYERVLAASSKSVEAHLGLSEITLEAGDGEAALSHGQAALRDLASGAHPMPLRIAVKLQLARCHRRAGATGAAMADLEDILELVPEHVAAHLELGRIYASLDQRARAAQHLAAALAANRENPEARRELEKVCRGAPSQRSGCPL